MSHCSSPLQALTKTHLLKLASVQRGNTSQLGLVSISRLLGQIRIHLQTLLRGCSYTFAT